MSDALIASLLFNFLLTVLLIIAIAFYSELSGKLQILAMDKNCYYSEVKE